METKTIETKLLRLSIIIGVVVLMGATAPFWHLFADRSSTTEFMGFVNLRSFLYSFGTHFAYLCGASFFFWIKNFIDFRYKRIAKIVNIIGGVFVGISVYFLLWTFMPISDFPEYVYHIAFIFSGAFISYGVYLLNNFTALMILDKKENIKNLLAFIIRVRTKHYTTIAEKALYAELHNEAMKAKDTVADNANEFEEDFYDTLEKVDNLNV